MRLHPYLGTPIADGDDPRDPFSAAFVAPIPSGALKRLARRIERTLARQGNSRMLLLGTSETLGLYAKDYASAGAGARPYSPGRVLTDLLNAGGIPAQDDNFTGNGNLGSGFGQTVQQYDARITGGSGWANDNNATGGYTVGGNSLNSNGSTNSLYFAPGGTFDRVEAVVGTATAGAGAATVAVNSVASPDTFVDVGAITSVGAATDFAKFSFSCQPATVVRITPNSTAPIYPNTVQTYLSTQSRLIVQAAATSGGRASGLLISGAFTLAQYLAAQGNVYDAIGIELGQNELAGAVATGTYSANLIAVRDAARNAYGADVFFYTAPFVSTASNVGIGFTGRSLAYTNTYRDVVFAAAGAAFPVVDLGGMAGTYAEASAAGLMADELHWSRLGIASVVAPGLARFVRGHASL